MRLFLCGDVMTGRGIDQILPHPCSARLYESGVTSALDYVELAERRSGPIARPVDPTYVWGDALEHLLDERLDARIINLETSVTTATRPEPKGINYRMHPANSPLLRAAAIDCCALANNHVLDWGEAGLLQTLDTLAEARIQTAGAGRDRRAAESPAMLRIDDARRVLVFACCTADSGIPAAWAATETRSGVNLLPDISDDGVNRIARIVHATKRSGDIAIASIHWGTNWGFDIPAAHRRFAHSLIERAAIDVIHGHSSHHPKSIEVHHGHLILYGCGDLINDYEGIAGHEELRNDLALMYFPSLDAVSGELMRLEMVPLRICKFRLGRTSPTEAAWLHATLDRECRRFGHGVVAEGERLVLQWPRRDSDQTL